MKGSTICNMCGKGFDSSDENQDFSIHRIMQRGSKYDGSVIAIDLCNKCADALISSCKLTPVLKTPEREVIAIECKGWV